jgi:hypothetical protein
MKTVTIRWSEGAWSFETLTDESCIIHEIKISRKEVNEIKLEDGTILSTDRETNKETLDRVEQQKWKNYNIFLEDITNEEDEEEQEEGDVDAQMGYMMSGCSSFDEYIERCNFPEDYE